MDGKHHSPKRSLRRRHQPSRLQDDIWTLVYEQLGLWTIPKIQPRSLPTSTRSQPASASSTTRSPGA